MIRIYPISLVLGCVGILLSEGAIAQVDRDVQRTLPIAPFPSPSPQPADVPLNAPPVSPPPATTPDAKLPFPVEQFQFEFERIQPDQTRKVETTPSVFTPEQLQAAICEGLQPPAADEKPVTTPCTIQASESLMDLTRAASAVTKLYIDQGYITTGAYIPADGQTISKTDRKATIRILEGYLEDVRVRSKNDKKPLRLNSDYIASRLRLAAGTPLNHNRLKDALRLLTIDPLVKSIQVTLSPGQKPGGNILDVILEESPAFSASALIDNQRSPSVGSFRRQIEASYSNLRGVGDRLSLAYSNTSGSHTGNVNYTLPVNPRDGILSLNIAAADSNIVEKPFSVLDIEANSLAFDLMYRQPLVRRPTHEFAIGATATHRISKATLLDGRLPFPSIGADRNGHVRLTALRLFQEASWLSEVERFGLRSQFNIGVPLLGATEQERGPDSQFVSWLGQAQWIRQLGREAFLVVRGDLQLAANNLLPSEQFGIGGQNSVRGYRQDTLVTDSGFFASAEVRIPVWRNYQSESVVQIVPFIDFGTGWNVSSKDTPSPDRTTLASAGLGLRLRLSDRMSARFDWGIPLLKDPKDILGNRKSLQENGLYFSVDYRLR